MPVRGHLKVRASREGELRTRGSKGRVRSDGPLLRPGCQLTACAGWGPGEECEPKISVQDLQQGVLLGSTPVDAAWGEASCDSTRLSADGLALQGWESRTRDHIFNPTVWLTPCANSARLWCPAAWSTLVWVCCDGTFVTVPNVYSQVTLSKADCPPNTGGSHLIT